MSTKSLLAALVLAVTAFASPSLAAPENDAFAMAIELPPPRAFFGSVAYTSVNGTNNDATIEIGEPIISTDDPGAHSVWYRFKADRDGIALINVQQDYFNPVFEVFVGSKLTNLKRLTAHSGGWQYVTAATFKMKKGITYNIRIDGVNGDEGAFKLNVFRFGPSGGIALIPWAYGPYYGYFPPVYNSHRDDDQVYMRDGYLLLNASPKDQAVRIGLDDAPGASVWSGTLSKTSFVPWTSPSGVVWRPNYTSADLGKVGAFVKTIRVEAFDGQTTKTQTYALINRKYALYDAALRVEYIGPASRKLRLSQFTSFKVRLTNTGARKAVGCIPGRYYRSGYGAVNMSWVSAATRKMSAVDLEPGQSGDFIIKLYPANTGNLGPFSFEGVCGNTDWYRSDKGIGIDVAR